jgi:hypothetical protein
MNDLYEHELSSKLVLYLEPSNEKKYRNLMYPKQPLKKVSIQKI